MRDKDTQSRACNEALEALRQLIPEELYWDVHSYVNRYDECQRGMELLLENISRHRIKIYAHQFRKVKGAMASMGLGGCDSVDDLWRNGVLHA